jgi:hypothetical protein
MPERKSKPQRSPKLPPELADFLRDQTYACLLQASHRGPVLVLKAPAAELATLQGTVPVRLLHELYSKPTAPVIRTVLSWYDRVDSRLTLETFTNVADPQQAEDFLRFAKQATHTVLAYDELLQERARKRVTNHQQRPMLQLLVLADKLRRNIPEDEYDFDLAKAAVQRSTSL